MLLDLQPWAACYSELVMAVTELDRQLQVTNFQIIWVHITTPHLPCMYRHRPHAKRSNRGALFPFIGSGRPRACSRSPDSFACRENARYFGGNELGCRTRFVCSASPVHGSRVSRKPQPRVNLVLLDGRLIFIVRWIFVRTILACTYDTIGHFNRRACKESVATHAH